MPNVPTFQLCLQEEGAEAILAIRTVTGLSADGARALAVALDNVTASVFSTVGISPADARAVLATMWRPQHVLESDRTAQRRPIGRTRIERDRQFLRDLGERIHVTRRARRLTLTGAARGTGIPAEMLRLVEAGEIPPTLLGLRYLADTLKVPLALLVDDKATPLRVLRLRDCPAFG